MLELNFKLDWNYKGKRGKETMFHTAIGSFLASMRDWAPAFYAMVYEVLEPHIDQQYESKGQGAWAELAPATLERKLRLGYPPDILVETGAMHASFKPGDQNNVMEVTQQSLKYGSVLPRSLFHQTGTGSGFQQRVKGGGRGVPMRKIIDLTEANKRALRSLMVQRLANIARREGFAVLGSEATPMSARTAGQVALGL